VLSPTSKTVLLFCLKFHYARSARAWFGDVHFDLLVSDGLLSARILFISELLSAGP
jgi:hypothetical protein